jgi:hypothetical protein
MFKWLFGNNDEPQHIDAVAAFQHAVSVIVRAAVDGGVTDEVIDNILIDATGKRRERWWEPPIDRSEGGLQHLKGNHQ